MKKSIAPPKRNYRRVFAPDFAGGINSFSDGRILPFDKAEFACNVSLESGALKNGYGITATDIPAYYRKLYYYKTYDEEGAVYKEYLLGYNSEDGCIYVRRENGWAEIEGARFGVSPIGVNYRLYGEDVYLLCGEEGMAVVNPSLRAVSVPSAPCVTSVAMHNERMFVTIGGRRNAVWFSDDLDPTNWNPELDEGGFIELEGESGQLNKAVAFGGYVYIFRDYGIARLSAYGDQSEFSVTNLFISGGKIYGDTVTVCGDRILFLAADGMYVFNGLSASRICRNLDGIISCEKPAACYTGGKYFLAFGDFMVAIDPVTHSASVNKGYEVQSFSPIVYMGGEALLAYVPQSDYIGRIQKGADVFGAQPVREWRSGMTDLGSPESRKLITDVYLDTEYDCEVTVRSDKGSKTVKLKGGRGVAHKRINLAGFKAGLSVKAHGNISAARAAIKYTVIS